MRKIHIVKPFQHGGVNYYAEEVVFVEPEDAGYFCGNGWAVFAPIDHPVPPNLEPVTLEVQDGGHSSTASEPS